MPRKKEKIKTKSSGAATPVSNEDWEARHGFETLMRAHEMSSNPTLMKRIKAHAKTQEERAARVARLEGKLL